MRIWLVSVGEPWPTDGDAPRLHRTGINAGYLASRGHQVVSWSGTFDHASKTERTGHDVDVNTSQGYRLIGISAGTYERNVSIKRIRYHRDVARRFRQLISQHSKPDVIVVSLTPLELARAAVDFGRKSDIPVVLDVRDMWPDIWAEQLPAPLQPFKRLIFAPFYADLTYSVRGATAVIGITDAAVDWALAGGGRKRSKLERAFPLAYTTEKVPDDKLAEASRHWRSLGIGSEPGQLIGCFFGTFTTRVDFETPLKAIAEMPAELQARVKLVLCGRGENEPLIRHYADQTGQIICHDWVQAPEIMALMKLSNFGLLPYRPTLDFVRSLPNKVFEYLSGELPIVTSLRGEIEGLVSKYGCGAFYESGSSQSFQALIAGLTGETSNLAAMTAGAKAAAEAYDPIVICEEFEGFLQDMVGRQKSTAA